MSNKFLLKLDSVILGGSFPTDVCSYLVLNSYLLLEKGRETS